MNFKEKQWFEKIVVEKLDESLVQNIYNGDLQELCIGSFSCQVSNVVVLFLLT